MARDIGVALEAAWNRKVPRGGKKTQDLCPKWRKDLGKFSISQEAFRPADFGILIQRQKFY